MRVLLLHADKFSYEAVKKAIKSAESLEEVPKSNSFENILVAFITVEPGDEAVIDEAADDLSSHLKRLGINKVVLYPYAHLSSNLAKPWEAVQVLRMLEEVLRKRGIEVYRAPFGWYKKFEISCKGHPLAELSRSYKPSRHKIIVKKMLVAKPDGTFSENLEVEDPDLRSLIMEVKGEKPVCKEDLAIKFCSKFGVVGKKVGAFCTHRYKPLAYFMYNSIMIYANYLASSLETPTLFIRGSVIDDSCSLNPIYCEGFCLRDLEISQTDELIEKELDIVPISVFEIAHLYRREVNEDVCKRCSSFTVPTTTTYLENFDDVYFHVLMFHDIIHREAEKVGRKYVVMYTVDSEFFNQNKDIIVKMVRRDNREALVRIVENSSSLMDAEYFITTNCGESLEIGSWSLYKKKLNDKELFVIKAAPLGSIERFLYMIFDKAAKDYKEKKTPSIPTWLAPIQVRIIPINRDLLTYALSIADELKSYGIRVDVDDRNIGLGKKVRDAGKEWIPYIVTIGEREKQTETIVVTTRVTNDKETMKVSDLVKRVKEDVGGYPQLPQTLPLLYSKRPKFAKPSS